MCLSDCLFPHYIVTHRSQEFHLFISVSWVPGAVPVTLSVSQFSRSVMSDSLQPHGLQHSRLPCSSPTPQACSNSCPLSQWCHPTISSSVVPFFSCPNLSQHQGLFPMNRLLSGGQGIGASASVLPMNIQGWFTLRLTGLISLPFKRLSRVFSSTTVWRHQFLGPQLSLWSNSHIHTWLLEKPQPWVDYCY